MKKIYLEIEYNEENAGCMPFMNMIKRLLRVQMPDMRIREINPNIVALDKTIKLLEDLDKKLELQEKQSDRLPECANLSQK